MAGLSQNLFVIGVVACCLGATGCGGLAPKKAMVPLAAATPKPATKSQKKQWEQATAMNTVMQKQVRNAVLASAGDSVAQGLRDQMTAEPNNPEARISLAEHYEEIGFTEIAVEHYRLIAERFPQSEKIQFRLAQALRKYGFSEEAAENLQAFLDRNPSQNPDLYSWLGIVLDDIGSLGDAEKAHRYAIFLAPRKDSLYNNLGYNLYLQGRNKEAELEIRRALQLNPNSPKTNNNLAIVMENREESLAQFRSTSDMATAYNNRAAEMMEQGRYPEARAELEKALQHRRDLPQIWNNLRMVGELDGLGSSNIVLPTAGETRPLLKRWASNVKHAFLGTTPLKSEQKESKSLGETLAGAAQD